MSGAGDSPRVAESPADRAAGKPPVEARPHAKPLQREDREKVRQHNNAQEATGGDLPDPKRAAAFDQDEG